KIKVCLPQLCFGQFLCSFTQVRKEQSIKRYLRSVKGRTHEREKINLHLWLRTAEDNGPSFQFNFVPYAIGNEVEICCHFPEVFGRVCVCFDSVNLFNGCIASEFH